MSNEVFPVAFAALTQPVDDRACSCRRTAETTALAARAAPSVLKVTASGGCGVTRVGHVLRGRARARHHERARRRRRADVRHRRRRDRARRSRRSSCSTPRSTSQCSGPRPRPARPSRSTPRIVTTGTQGAVVGFPGGGPRTATPAGVAGTLTRPGSRHLRRGPGEPADLRRHGRRCCPGNSGSPLIDRERRASGMVFSRSLSQPGLAYAIRASALVGRGRARRCTSTRSVGAGACTPG